MKKLTTAIAVTSLLAVSAFAQGTVDFRNRNTAVGFDVPIYDGAPALGVKLGGANFVAQLFFSANAAGPMAPIAGDTPSPFRTGTGAGYWVPSGGDFTRVLAGIPVGTTAYLQVRVWDSSLGAGYAESLAAGGKVGQSTVFSVATGGVGSPPSVPATMVGLTSFGVAVIPEPATYALLALGAGALLLRRRK